MNDGNPPYDPKGIRFFDLAKEQEMLLVADGEDFAGWICYRHPDGQWVTLRKATENDRAIIDAAQQKDERDE